MINVVLSGANGKMGRVIARLIEGMEDIRVCAGVDLNEKPYADFPIYSSPSDITENADVIIDFSNPAALSGVLKYATEKGIPSVIATTGLSEEQIESLKVASETVPVFFSANMSLGVNLLIGLVKRATQVLYDGFDIEIIEKHHNQKIDSPSGTALAIANAISSVLPYDAPYQMGRSGNNTKRTKPEIGIHAVRGGTIVGEHDVVFAGNDEIIEIKHTAQSKEIFAVGAIKAAKFLTTVPLGMYSMDDIIK